MLRKLFFATVLLVLVLGLGGALAALWGFNYITRDLPKLSRVEDYRPDAVSEIFDREGNSIAEVFETRRYPLKIREVPDFVKDAFVAAEDATFYSHPGIDVVSIFRALVKNLKQGGVRQGGSTITQQVVKNLLLTPEKSIERKIKEAVLSYRLERILSKDEILEIYFNQIFFGEDAYGLKAAARNYFRREVAELSVAQAAMLAGLPKAPSRYSPSRNLARAKKRQRYVLDQMVRAGFISQRVADEAFVEELEIFSRPKQNFFAAPYYVAEVKRIIEERFSDFSLLRDGLRVFTHVDVAATQLAEISLKKGVRATDKRVGWRGPLKRYEGDARGLFVEEFPPLPSYNSLELYPALVLSAPRSASVRLLLGTQEFSLNLSKAKWARRFLSKTGEVRTVRPERLLKAGDLIEVRIDDDESFVPRELTKETKFELAQTPKLQGAISLLEAATGNVRVMLGGYDYSASQFNRVTQALRQPGSAFKPIVYLSAIDGFGYSPSTTVFDVSRQFRVGEDVWEPGNFDDNFLGGITMRVALEKSRNLASADIIAKIGVDSVIRYSRLLGIESPLRPNLSLALGSNEVTMLELLQAYGVIANGGVFVPGSFIDRIEDRDGKVLYEGKAEQLEKARRVVRESSAFVLANMLKGVVQSGTGWRVRELGRPAGGKTGTSNDSMDAWFMGLTPEWICGVWVGFDKKRPIGKKETGGKVAAPIWLNFMKPFLDRYDQERLKAFQMEEQQRAEELGLPYIPTEEIEVADFIQPEGVVPLRVVKATGQPAEEADEGTIVEYFVEGTEPTVRTTLEQASSYLESPDL